MLVMKTWFLIKQNILYLSWVQALVATFGSLYGSEVLGWLPCVLCWYQRIAMYPLVVIIPAGILLKDKNLPYYVLPLSLTGLLIALYQYLLQMGVFPTSLIPCSAGVSCNTRYIELFNFITLPFLSFLAFAFITLSMVIFLKEKK